MLLSRFPALVQSGATPRAGMALVAFILLASTAPAVQQTTTRVSTSSAGLEGDGFSTAPVLASDGRSMAFYSRASNLVPGDTNGVDDVFVRDLVAGTIERVSVGSGGLQSNARSGAVAISGDGRHVAFASDADNLVAGDTNGTSDVFVHDRLTGITERASLGPAGVQGDRSSGGRSRCLTCPVEFLRLSISRDGRYVGFPSMATNLASGDTNDTLDIFVHDRDLGTTALVSRSSAGRIGTSWSFGPVLSGDGRFCAFASHSDNLVAGDTNGSVAGVIFSGIDVFLHDLASGETERVSLSSSDDEGDRNSGGYLLQSFDGVRIRSLGIDVSIDGRYVAFASRAGNLVPGDTNGPGPPDLLEGFDVFVRDRLTGTTSRASETPSGAEVSGASVLPALSDTGRYIAFVSSASTLVAGDVNDRLDVFVKDRMTGQVDLVSQSTGGAFGAGSSGGFEPCGIDLCNLFPYGLDASADGSRIAFYSEAANLVANDSNALGDVFLRDRGILPPTLYCVAQVNSQGCAPELSFQGQPAASAANGFVLEASRLINGQAAQFFYGLGEIRSTPFQGGTLCFKTPFVRVGPPLQTGGSPSGVDCTGMVAVDFNSFIASGPPAGLVPGAVVRLQCWSRDPSALPAGVNLTGALEFTLGP